MPRIPRPIITDEMKQSAHRILTEGGSKAAVARDWKITPQRLNVWMERYGDVRKCIEDAIAERDNLDTGPISDDPLDPQNVEPLPRSIPRIPLLIDNRHNESGDVNGRWKFVAGLLPMALRPLWNTLVDLHREKYDVYELASKIPPHHAQQLFFYTYVEQCFNTTYALMFLAMERVELEKWVKNYVDFNEAWRGSMWHKRNFYESCLIKSCVAGQAVSIIFANKATNEKRGYGDKLPAPTTAEPKTNSDQVAVKDLDLPFAVKEQMLEALRKSKDKDKAKNAE